MSIILYPNVTYGGKNNKKYSMNINFSYDFLFLAYVYNGGRSGSQKGLMRTRIDLTDVLSTCQSHIARGQTYPLSTCQVRPQDVLIASTQESKVLMQDVFSPKSVSLHFFR